MKSIFRKISAGLLGWALLLVPAAGIGTAALVATATSAFAVNNPIPGIDIIVRKEPGGSAMRVQTGRDGGFTFAKLTPGTYTLTLDGKSLAMALEKLDPKPTGTKQTILVGILLPAIQKTIVSSRQTFDRAAPKSIAVTFTVPDSPAAAKGLDGKGSLTLMR